MKHILVKKKCMVVHKLPMFGTPLGPDIYMDGKGPGVQKKTLKSVFDLPYPWRSDWTP